jgi:glycosyltransferase involved in cell wall biosynthesis
MLTALFRRLQSLTHGDTYDIFYVVIDNDAECSARAVVEAFGNEVGNEKVQYFFEPKTGIPFVRNLALQHSASLGADLGAFIDDDEYPDPEWLSELVNCYRKRRLDLIGGPVRPRSWGGRATLTRWEKLVLSGVVSRYLLKERRSAWMKKAGTDGNITIITSNWLINFNWWKKEKLFFEEKLRYSGGSDALFYLKAKELGAKTGWCPTAIVYESNPPQRLTLAYQFRRARAQAISGFFRKYETNSFPITCSTLFSILLKILAAVLLLLVVPFRPGIALVQSARSLGWASGRIHALFGTRSNFYRTADGE